MNYEVIYPMRHDGKLHEPGAVVDLDDGVAASLLAAKVIKKAQKAEPVPATGDQGKGK